MKVANMRLVRLHFDDLKNNTYESYITLQQAAKLQELLSQSLALIDSESQVEVKPLSAILTPNKYVDSEITIYGLNTFTDGSDGTGDPTSLYGALPGQLSINIPEVIALMQYLSMFPKIIT